MQVSKSSVTQHALGALKVVHTVGKKADPRLDLIEMAMHGGKMGFGKIIKMIDGLVVELKAEIITTALFNEQSCSQEAVLWRFMK